MNSKLKAPQFWDRTQGDVDNVNTLGFPGHPQITCSTRRNDRRGSEVMRWQQRALTQSENMPATYRDPAKTAELSPMGEFRAE